MSTASTAPEEVEAAAARAEAERLEYEALKQGNARWSLATTVLCFAAAYTFYSRVCTSQPPDYLEAQSSYAVFLIWRTLPTVRGAYLPGSLSREGNDPSGSSTHMVPPAVQKHKER